MAAPAQGSLPPRRLTAAARRWSRWLQARDFRYVVARGSALVERYGLTSELGRRRVLEGVEFLGSRGCSPTLPTPGRVLDGNGPFCAALQTMGVELAVHGYDHLNFLDLSPAAAKEQFDRALNAFARWGIRAEGFRCPYLGFNRDLLTVLPPGAFSYSSNETVWHDVVTAASSGGNNVFNTLHHFYQPDPSESPIATPRFRDGIVEIPVSVPDDIQLLDGTRGAEEGLARAWSEMLQACHRRGELFVVLFHPELFPKCYRAFDTLLRQCKSMQPHVWVARLRDVAEWWRERSTFRAGIASDGAKTTVHLECSSRATVLARNLQLASEPWAGSNRLLKERTFTVGDGPLPFVGLSQAVPPETVSLLREEGYICIPGAEASRCSIYLDEAALQNAPPLALLEAIESSPAPLVRFWRWPNAAKSAMCITGDLDAVSLRDYAIRLFV